MNQLWALAQLRSRTNLQQILTQMTTRMMVRSSLYLLHHNLFNILKINRKKGMKNMEKTKNIGFGLKESIQ
jgi:hypothetical protein